ncbi:MAG: glycoside hydrolase family 31 protein [Spirochaetales bacterium]|nr:glycoside hydrolase family 31 protein [Spirochaetales bacterium]
MEKIIDYKKKKNNVKLQFADKKYRVEVLDSKIIRFFSGKKSTSFSVTECEFPEPCWSLEEGSNNLILKTDDLMVEINDGFLVDIFDTSGKVICRDYRGKRQISSKITEETLSIISGEGHSLVDKSRELNIQVCKKMDGDECFYGLGDKTGFLNKRGYYYEMWNSDLPEPQVDSFVSLYKSIPFFIVLKDDCVFGIFFDNTYKTCFNMGQESDDYYYFGADKGNLDYYFIYGSTMSEVLSSYMKLTGTVPLPQMWTLGYHQSRWGYDTEEQIKTLASRMRSEKVPCDCIHLDIDYMDNYKVFTWNKKNYLNPKAAIKSLSKQGFKMITIIDPGVKKEKGYHIYDEGVAEGYFATTPKGKIYKNKVWPGDSVFPDFGKEKVRKWWANNQQFLLDMGIRGIWNDMNEPASFNGPLPDDVVFHDEERVSTHEKMHNVYGHLMAKATYEGLKDLDKRRPFVITRACYAGSQKYATAWTGDNHSIWAHLQMAVPQLCNLGLSGMSYVGTDIGGFGSDTTPELLLRWIEVGCFSPLFRNHSGRGTREQEPWQFGDEVLSIYRKYVELRYRLIPYYYDLFFKGEQTGLPVMRPLILHYQNDKEVQNKNDEFLVGESILVAPVLMQGETKKMVYLPAGDWFDYWTGEKVQGGDYFLRDAPLDLCPIYIKAGSIIPNFPVQQFIGEQNIENLILDIYPGKGEYHHFQDDGETFAYREGKYNEYKISLDDQNLLTVSLEHNGYEPVYKGFTIMWKGKERQVAFSGSSISLNLEG